MYIPHSKTTASSDWWHYSENLPLGKEMVALLKGVQNHKSGYEPEDPLDVKALCSTEVGG